MDSKTQKDEPSSPPPTKTCGLIMPISGIDDCTELHWNHVRRIIEESLSDDGFIVSMVSESDEATIIHRSIILNTYQSDIIICDVSARNANVMLELGMRLAFNKPVVIIKDDVTPYVFDASIIEHIPYPRDLNYYGVARFKELIKRKVNATLSESEKAGHQGFLHNFGEFKVAELNVQSVPPNELMLYELKLIRQEIDSLRQPEIPENNFVRHRAAAYRSDHAEVYVGSKIESLIIEAINLIQQIKAARKLLTSSPDNGLKIAGNLYDEARKFKHYISRFKFPDQGVIVDLNFEIACLQADLGAFEKPEPERSKIQ